MVRYGNRFGESRSHPALSLIHICTTIYNADRIAEVLRLPEGVLPVTTVTLGWPEEMCIRDSFRAVRGAFRVSAAIVPSGSESLFVAVSYTHLLRTQSLPTEATSR